MVIYHHFPNKQLAPPYITYHVLVLYWKCNIIYKAVECIATLF